MPSFVRCLTLGVIGGGEGGGGVRSRQYILQLSFFAQVTFFETKTGKLDLKSEIKQKKEASKQKYSY